jgi:DNA polymerase-3 subunit gamma/tau
MLYQSQISDALLSYDAIVKKGFDGSTFLGGLASHFRNLAVCKETKTQALVDVSDSFKTKYIEQSAQFSFAFILNSLSLVSEAEEKYKASRNPRLLVELLLMKLGHLQSFIQNIPSLEEVKKKLSNSDSVKSSSFKNAPSIVEEKVKPNINKVSEKSIAEATKTQEVATPVESSAVGSAPISSVPISTTPVAKAPIAKPPTPAVQIITDKSKLSGFEAFKRQKELLAKSQSEAESDENVLSTTDSALEDKGSNSDRQSTETAQPTPNSDSGLASIETYNSLEDAYVGFYQTQGPRISTCLKSLRYRLNDGQLVIELSTSGQESIIEEIKPQLMQFLKRRLPGNQVKNIGWEMGEIQVVERRPYTDKEKLDYLVKKHPALGEALESLHLRLP